jgi:hypothetical protein
MARKKVPVERKSGLRDEVVESHPSFGIVGLFKTQGSQPLFGSPLKLNNGYVTLKIQRAERCRSGHGYESYFPGKTIVEVMMSEAQFAQFITCWNSGAGVPCTLDFIASGGEGDMPSWPDEDQTSDTDRVKEDFNARVEDLRRKIDASVAAMDAILEKKGSLTKAEKEKLTEGMRALRRFFYDSGPFICEQFVEVTEQVVQKAMTEVDAFVTKVVMNTGLEALKDLQVAGLKLADGSTPERLSTGVPQLDATLQEGIPWDPYLEGIMNRSERVLHPGDAICSKCSRKFSMVGRNPVYEGPTVCDDCEADELRDKGVL